MLIDIVIVPVINSFECSSYAEIIAGLEGSLNIFCFQMQFDFLENQLAHRSLDSHWQEFVGVELLVRSLGCSRSKERIITGQKDLEEIVIIKFAISVEIKVVDHEDEVLW